MQASCVRCRASIQAGEEYRLDRETLCEDCYYRARLSRPRKTHWQYLPCVKTGYMREARKG